MARALNNSTNYCFIMKKHTSWIWLVYACMTYCAVFVRMDVRRACSSVRAEGTLVGIQSVPFGGLLTGFGGGISGLLSSES